MKKILLMSILALSLFACGKDNDSSNNETKVSDKAKTEKAIENPAKKRGDIINVAIANKFEGKFNPTIAISNYDSIVNSYIFEGLLVVKNDFTFEPESSIESFEYDEDKMQYIFHLKKGIKFHDGVEFTSEDVKFTYSLFARPEYVGAFTPASESIKGFKEVADGKSKYLSGIETPDKYTVIFNMSEANGRSLNNFTPGIIPKHYYEYDKAENYKTDFLAKNETPVGSGPYKLSEYKPGEYVVLERFGDYYQGNSEPKKIVIKYVPSESIAPSLASGDLDISNITGRISREKEIASKNNLVNFQKIPPSGYSYIAFNMRKDVFKDKTLRQALAYGLNRELYAEKILEGYAKVVNQPLVPQHWANSKNVNNYAYNPEKAKKMLEEDGWKLGEDGFRYKDGKKLTFTLKTSSSSGESSTGKTWLALIKENWKEIGVDVDIQLVDFNALVKDILSKKPTFDTVMLSWSPLADPDQSSVFKTGAPYNFAGYSSKVVDDLCVEGLKEIPTEKRKPIYEKMMEQINEDLPYIFTTSSIGVVGINKRLSGLDYMNNLNLLNAAKTGSLKIEK